MEASLFASSTIHCLYDSFFMFCSCSEWFGLQGFEAGSSRDDFFFSGLELAGNTSTPFGSKVTPVTAAQLPVLNTLGIALVRVDYEPWGINPPHTHPRASEILAVLEGSLQVGFVT
jgi:hypothetical protein